MGVTGVISPATRDVEQFFSVLVSSFRIDKVMAFDMYIKPDARGAPVLYRERNQPFSEDVRQRLVDTHTKELYVPYSQKSEYRGYLQEFLTGILEDTSIPLPERCGILYSSATGIVEDIMDDAREGRLTNQGREFARNTVGFLFSEPRAIHDLLRVTSYDYYTYTHCVNVFIFSASLAKFMGHETDTVLKIAHAALLHDVGKCQIDTSIVNCPGKLSPEQWQEMKRHPVYGHTILQKNPDMDSIALDVTRHHHEKLTGDGYPDGLTSKEISAQVRICTIADIFDALTTRRVYKEAIISFEALKLMRLEMAQSLDFGFLKCFIEMLAAPACA